MSQLHTRNDRRKGKRKKIRTRILSLFLILAIAAVGFSVYEFNQGYLNASTKITNLPSKNNDSDNTAEFKGQKDEFGKVNVLLLGVDSTTSAESRTDTIMIAQYDPKKGTAKLASIMRDTYVSIPGYANNKINSAYVFGGAELLRQTIKENLGIDVQYYALVNFDGFKQVVDVVAPDGVKIDVEKRMRYVDNAGGLNINLDPGVQTLNGEELLGYARFRHDNESDFGRVRRQQQVINAVKDEFISVKGVVKLPRILGTIEPYIKSNLSKGDILALSKDFLLNPADQIETLRIPVDDSYRLGRADNAGSVIIMDEDMNKQALKDFFSLGTDKQTAELKKVKKAS